ncbi:hypothetical protein FJ251_02170 [bacterium]|nr:hypothetical protein [bacterium]
MKRRLPLLPALLLVVCLAATTRAAESARRLEAGLPPAETEILRSDEAGLSLVLRFVPDAFQVLESGLSAELAGCALASGDPQAPRAPGAPMLPIWRGLVALPPGMEASLSWRAVASEPIAGEPLPFPTPRAVPAGEDFLYDESFVRDPVAFAKPYPIAARLGEPHWLRDQRVVELSVTPLGWSAERGLTLARELRVEIGFRAAAAERAAAAAREPLRRSDRHWERLYASALLNPEPAAAWRQRVPARYGLGGARGARAEAALKLLTPEDGLYAVVGDSLIARGIPAGTELAQIALFRRRLSWDGTGQPDFRETAEPRYFLDGDGDGRLDPADRLVFLGWRLRHAPGSLDPIEWYGRAEAYFVGVAPALALEMLTESAWSEAGAWPLRADFKRQLWQQGEQAFHQAPPNWYYNGPSIETWDDNLYFYAQPLAPEGYVLRVPLATPAAVPDSSALLKLQFQGASRSTLDGLRTFSVALESGTGGCVLDPVEVAFHYTIDYVDTVPAGCLEAASSTLVVDRTDGTQFRTFVKWVDLTYSSGYAVRQDSLYFHADGAGGPAEIRISGLTGDRSGWQLLRLGAAGQPTRVQLAAANQAGGPGAYELRLRRDLAGDEAWWLADAARLRAPTIAPAAAVDVLDETAPCDILVIANDGFAAGMQPWLDRRTDEGYRVRLLTTATVWDAFFGGVRGAIGLRNAARFAYQQWGAEALLLVGDANKDARGLGPDAMPDFVPVHSKHEYVGVDALVALEEWVVKWNWNDWPALLMGRLPVGSPEELAIILEKIACYEGGCEPDGAWRRRFLLGADDCWIWDDPAEIVYCRDNERQFEIAVEAMRPLVADSWVGDLRGVPYYLSAQTDAWYAEHSPVYPTELETLLRPIVAPVFIDSLSQGYLWASIQSHANRGQLCHELIFKTAAGGHDQDFLTNANRPFFWALFGCHGNEFATHNEERSNVGDCLGEHLLFADANRGAVASYASDGFEYLFPNLRWQRDWHEIMVSATDPEQSLAVLPAWRAGDLQLIAELRLGDKDAAYRTNLLGDPLLRLSAGAPRLRLFVNEQEMAPGDFVPPQVTGDTLRIEALVWDENYLTGFSLSDSARAAIPFQATPAFTAEASFPLDSLAPFDTTAVEATGRGRAWHLAARQPYDFGMDALVLSAEDLAGTSAEFVLPVPKSIKVYLAESQLREGQWVRPRGTLRIDILVPSPELLPDRFGLLVDGAASGISAVPTDSSTLHRMELPYAWSPGAHSLVVLLDGEEYGGLTLRVDAATRLLAGRIFPNPFRNVVTFHFELTNGVREGTLSIYTLSGRRVFRRELGALAEGQTQVISWDGRDGQGDKIANGTYIARLALTDLRGEAVFWEDKVVRMR